jgi:hypothetical protein
MYDYSNIYDKEIYTKSLIISGNLTEYNPKIVNMFMWEAPDKSIQQRICNNLNFTVDNLYYADREAENIETGLYNIETYIGFNVNNLEHSPKIKGFNVLIHHQNINTELLFSLGDIYIPELNSSTIETTRLNKNDDVVKIKIIPRITDDSIVCDENGLIFNWEDVQKR